MFSGGFIYAVKLMPSGCKLLNVNGYLIEWSWIFAIIYCDLNSTLELNFVVR
jgi:hypothetical protein